MHCHTSILLLSVTLMNLSVLTNPISNSTIFDMLKFFRIFSFRNALQSFAKLICFPNRSIR